MDALRLTKKLFSSFSFWNVRRVWHLARTQGVMAVWDRAVYALTTKASTRYMELEPRPRELARQRRITFAYQPTISLAVATFNTPLPFLQDLIDSIFAQSYPHWTLRIADGGSTEPGVLDAIKALVAKHPDKIRATFLPENHGIAGNQNEAIKLCDGDFIALIDHDDRLTGNALYEMVARINQDRAIDLIYSDEAIMDAAGQQRLSVHLKPDYAPDTLRGCNYFCHLTLYRKDLMAKIGGLRLGFDGAQDYDLVLRATENAASIAHVPKILYLWRMHQGSTAQSIDAKPYALDAGRRAIQDHLERIGLKGRVESAVAATYRTHYDLRTTPKVSIIVPNKDQHALLKNCIDSVLNLSTYPNFEILVVENNSCDLPTFKAYRRMTQDPRVRLASLRGKFNFSNLVNFGAEQATGEFLLFLNNDTEVITPSWIEKLLEFAQREDVGAVGCKLLYADHTIQHAGVVVGIFGVAGHVHRNWWVEDAGYIGRLCTAQNLSAVTGACMMVRKSDFQNIGGFDPQFAVAFNDIDFCLRLRKLGKLVVWTPEASLYHFESQTRGLEDSPEKLERFKKEIAVFQDRWRDFLRKGDPYYNPNLTLLAEDFRLGSPFDGITIPFPY